MVLGGKSDGHQRRASARSILRGIEALAADDWEEMEEYEYAFV